MNHVYPKDFDTWWEVFSEKTPSPKGFKYEAFVRWERMKEDGRLGTLEELVGGVQKCVNNDAYFRSKKQSIGSWKHGCRWLSNYCWMVEDEGEAERNRKIKARQRRVEKERQVERESLSGWIDSMSHEEYKQYQILNGHGYDWLWEEKKERNEKCLNG